MSDNNTNNNFVAWEYANIKVCRNNAPLYKDCYENFGWQFIAQEEMEYSSEYSSLTTPQPENENSKIILKFKRDSRLPNKLQINKLQKECEDALSSIDKMENTKSAYKMGGLLGFGMVGALGLGLAIYSFATANVLTGALFTAISVVGWAGALYTVSKTVPKKSNQINPQIQEQFDVVYKSCEQANALLS